MTDVPSKKDLAATLARLEQGWQELSRLIQEQAEPAGRTIVAEKFVLEDAKGQPRASLETRADGSCGLIFLDRVGRFRAWLGVRENGDAYLSLKDEMGRVVFESQDLHAVAAADSPPARLPGVTAYDNAVPDERFVPEATEAASTLPQAEPHTSMAADLNRRLARLERKNRRLEWVGGVGVALLFTALSLAVFSTHLVLKPKPSPVPVRQEVTTPALVITGEAGTPVARLGAGKEGVRLEFYDHQGGVRARFGLQAEGGPQLSFFDRQHRLRAELALAGLEAEPRLALVDQLGLLRVALGSVDPRFKVPGYLLERPVSSLVFINKDGEPVWHAPTKWRR